MPGAQFQIVNKNNILYFLFLFATTILIFFSCKKDEKATVPMSGDYLPLQVQNYWEFQDNLKINIIGTKIIDNKLYFTFLQEEDTSYYRNENNKIFVRRSSGNESVKFDLAANTGDSWEYMDGGTSWTVTLTSKTDTITINKTKIPNCYSFFFDIPMAADDEHSFTLAPGIGFIKNRCGFCFNPMVYLRKAIINNAEITFP